MAKTIEQIQAMITTKYDMREVINEIADYLQFLSGGGGGGGVQSVTGNSVDNTDALNPVVGAPNLQDVTAAGSITGNGITITDNALQVANAGFTKSVNIFGADGFIGFNNNGSSIGIYSDNLVSSGGVAPVLQLPNAPHDASRTFIISITDANGTHIADANGNIDLT